ncbi:hypothetical protein HZD78_14075 [Mycobacteroides chelonae]|uniref:hypothetical protein n=1 Tax=Mycobacteroides chelonae TaxID=1774 RepID=UPI001C45DE0C|nr:hypothetical protein [Mycobacteroides chelonae]MBV6359940.1 hypothetical protein [Mycobacteroides chelonae]MBV6361081.1 hypothetical protein [Mycobacteroides chelonae]UJW64600.1 hypothetical protein H0I67_17315 [Mycobacteroides chelonae]UJW67984.1 hypothetical protein H0I67_12375 [Mycobacteroides chelonae]
MVQDAGVAQARSLLISLYELVNEVSDNVDTAEQQIRHTPGRGSMLRHQQRRVSVLRKDLYEAHRLIDVLHQRFPATRGTAWPV